MKLPILRQYVPEEVCLKCQGCCRFKDQSSVWSPCLLDEEIQDFVDENIPSAFLSADKHLMPVTVEGKDGFFCSFLHNQDNKCKIYSRRPLECQLYPFLISLRQKQVLLTVDLNCPYVHSTLNSQEFKRYSEYLSAYLNSPKMLRLLKDNPHILQAYEDVLDVAELQMPDEIK